MTDAEKLMVIGMIAHEMCTRRIAYVDQWLKVKMLARGSDEFIALNKRWLTEDWSS